jgi:O-antigen biosynthesis protein WbqP
MATYDQVKRAIDVCVSASSLVTFSLPLTAIALAIRLTSHGPVIHWSRRIGKGNQEFWMPKFRTMRIDTPEVASHLLNDPQRYITPIGRFLRKTSLDELPQLLTILNGNMTIVGPRPALYNQVDLIQLRTQNGVHQLTPGLTGWAQINGRDELPIPQKVEYDKFYLENRSFTLDVHIIIRTALKAITGEGVAH